MHAVALQLLQ